jgi:hypothetical protein
MPRILLAILAVLAGGALHAAAAQNYPFCLMGCDFGAGDCSYNTYSQCQAAASGREAWCAANPFFHQSGESQPSRNKISRRKF